MPFFNQYNCCSSIERHNTGHEMRHSDHTTTKQIVLLLYGLYGRNALFIPTWRCLRPLNSERHRKWRQDVTKQVLFCCLQMPGGPGHYYLPNAWPLGLSVYQMPGGPGHYYLPNALPLGLSVYQMPGVYQGDVRGWNWLAHNLNVAIIIWDN